MRSELIRGSLNLARYTCVTNSRVEDLYTNFVGFRGCYFDLLNAQGLASFPGDGGLALDGLSRHDRTISLNLTN